MDTSVEHGDNLLAIFGQRTLEQSLLSLVAWIVILRYCCSVPIALPPQLLGWPGRTGMGQLKPVVVPDPPPGEIGSYIFMPLVAIALWFSLPWKGDLTGNFGIPG